MDDILDDAGRDNQPWDTETSSSLEEVQDNSQLLLTYWEMEYRKNENVDLHLISMDDTN